MEGPAAPAREEGQDRRAVVGLALGAAGLVLLAVTLGWAFFVAFPLGIAAVWLGIRARDSTLATLAIVAGGLGIVGSFVGFVAVLYRLLSGF